MIRRIGTYNFPPHRRGDAFEGASFAISVDGTPLNLSGSNVLVQFRLKDYTVPSLVFSTDSGSISIQGENQNIISLAQRSGSEMNLTPGDYYYDVDIQFTDNINKTYIEGYLPIVTDYSIRGN